MFTKSQLVAAAVLVASASSVVASPIYNDVTDMEARGYTRDALTELKRRAVLEYLEELEARDPTGARVHSALANGGKSSSTHKHVHAHANAEKQKTTHTQHHDGQHHLASGNKAHASEKIHKTGGQRATVHHDSNNHRLSATHHSSAHGQALVKEPSSSTHRHSHGASANSPASAASSLKGSHHSQGQPSTSGSKKVIKRSVLEYLGDLVGRAPTENTSASGAAKGSTQSTPASAKAHHPSAVTGGHKETAAHGHHNSNVVGGHKGTGAHSQHASNAAGTHKEGKGPTHRHSSHHQTDDHNKISKHTTPRTRPHGRLSLGTKQRVHGLSHQHNANANGHKEPTVHDHHRVASSHANLPDQHVRVKHSEKQTSTSNTAASHQHQHGATSHSSPAPIHNQPQKQQSLKSREIEELAELIARELDLYDELD